MTLDVYRGRKTTMQQQQQTKYSGDFVFQCCNYFLNADLLKFYEISNISKENKLIAFLDNVT